MSLLPFRRGHAGDEEWLFQLFRETMQDYIDQAWGWEELLQQEGFRTSLPAKDFQILQNDSLSVGCYHLTENADHLLLDIIMVDPQWQGMGYGRRMMEQVQQISLALQRPIRLRVLQTNPAVGFHKKLGFSELTRDQHSLEMIWRPEDQ